MKTSQGLRQTFIVASKVPKVSKPGDGALDHSALHAAKLDASHLDDKRCVLPLDPVGLGCCVWCLFCPAGPWTEYRVRSANYYARVVGNALNCIFIQNYCDPASGSKAQDLKRYAIIETLAF